MENLPLFDIQEEAVHNFADGEVQDGITRKGLKWAVHCGDACAVLKGLPDSAFDCVVTSPPYYWLRDYGIDGQIGQEETVAKYVKSIVKVMDEVYRVLKPEGTMFLNIGDTYYSGKGESQGVDRKSTKRRFGLRAVDKSGGLGIGLRPKTLIGIPWRVAIAMTHKRWILRSPIIWHRKGRLAEAVLDRPRRSYEYVFMFVKGRKYNFNRDALVRMKIEEDMWTIAPRPKVKNGLDTAPFPDELVNRCLSVGCPANGSVLDPFAGSGTTVRVALQLGREATGVDLNPQFCQYMVSQLKTL